MEKNALLQPIQIGHKVVPNRFAINAMEGVDADENGNPTDRTYARYEGYFTGEAGFIDLEAITCQYDSISSRHQLSIMPHNAKALEQLVQRLKRVNSNNVFVLQLTHAGEVSDPRVSKQIRVTQQPLYGFEGAELIGEDDVEKIIQQYVQSAVIAHDVGADGIDLKLCAGYLGSQILRPFNRHSWKYGGSWENRRQFAFDLVERIQDAVNDPSFIIGSKISLYEGFPGGQGTAGPESAVMDLTESIDLIQGLEARGASYILQTCGAPRHTLALVKPDRSAPYIAYLGQYFQKVCRDNLKPETVVIGGGYSIFRDGKQPNFQAVAPEKNSLLHWGDQMISEGVTDMVALGRQCLADPYLPKKLREGREQDIKWCTGCDQCSILLVNQAHTGCIVGNPYYANTLKGILADSK
ncbi:MAG: 2,4-dienoyl-CoA reductase [Oscillospiraceae bacterium]|nr:2,4-dienoyl-CoA reductase [Oscillospiraceae bacterium]